MTNRPLLGRAWGLDRIAILLQTSTGVLNLRLGWCSLPFYLVEHLVEQAPWRGTKTRQSPWGTVADMGAGHLYRPTIGALRVPYIGAYATPSGAKVETKNHHKTMKYKVSEAEILRTPIKIEKVSLWNRSGSGFTMNFEFHRFQEKRF